MYYAIDCYYGNGDNKHYPSDHICIFDENLNDIIDKFILAHKYFDFTKWKICYFEKWIYEGGGEYGPTEPIPIKFENRCLKIEGVGIFQIDGVKYET